MPDKKPFQVCYTVLLTEQHRARLLREAEKERMDPTDSEDLLLKRYLMFNGIDNCFKGDDANGLEFTLHITGHGLPLGKDEKKSWHQFDAERGQFARPDVCRRCGELRSHENHAKKVQQVLP